MCGMGRTGRWFACQHYDVIPDIITLGKGLSGGTLALSAVGVKSIHFETICHGSGIFVHGGTFSHNPVAAAAGLAVINILEREGLVERASQYGALLGDKLKERLEGLACVSDIRGIGLMWGVELVENKDTNTPFPRHKKVIERVWDTLFEKGIITYKSIGLAGTDGDALIIAPPFIIKKDEIDFLVDTVGNALEEIIG
jgi:adenosylmethionine-8-amino-7-oxononanoate aminotransferase